MDLNMDLKEAWKRIEELERRLAELERAPKQEGQYHAGAAPMVFPPVLPYMPPAPGWRTYPTWIA